MKKVLTYEQLVEKAESMRSEISDLEWTLDCLRDDLDNVTEQMERYATPADEIKSHTTQEIEEHRSAERQAKLLKSKYGAEHPSVSIADYWTHTITATD